MECKNCSTADKVNMLLLTYNFVIDGNIPNNLKCDLCRNLLVNACQSRCGCRFCSKCITEYLSKGNIYCPGETSDCKEENLTICSNTHTDYRVIREISKLKVKCPEETCKVYCELIDMEEHLRLCTMKNVDCPFVTLGCNHPKIAIKDMNGHLQSGNFQHSKLLIDIISNLKNDVFSLMLKEKEYREKMELLKEDMKSQDEKIALLNDEIRIIKVEKEELRQQLENFKLIFDTKIEELSEKLNADRNKTKQECAEILNLEIFKISTDFKTFKDDIESKLDEIEQYLKRKIDETSGIFSWNVSGISIKRTDNQSVFSEYFYTKVNRHKISLQLAANGSNDVVGIGCSIFLFIYSGIQDIKHIWPFEANVTIKIVNKSMPDVFKTMSKYCKIDKPPNNYNWSDPFYFYYTELDSVGLLHDDCFTIECFVDEK